MSVQLVRRTELRLEVQVKEFILKCNPVKVWFKKNQIWKTLIFCYEAASEELYGDVPLKLFAWQFCIEILHANFCTCMCRNLCSTELERAPFIGEIAG